MWSASHFDLSPTSWDMNQAKDGTPSQAKIYIYIHTPMSKLDRTLLWELIPKVVYLREGPLMLTDFGPCPRDILPGMNCIEQRFTLC